ncbi:MAG: adenylyltransferase/cytidyltransferase family protein [Candidatus Binatia bacterium]
MKPQYGMIHGRFQPFHNGHWQYACAALDRCERLVIGITNPDPSLIVREVADEERHRPEANVFSFFERLLMIQATIIEAKIDSSRLIMVPFPIHQPELWPFYCPRETTQFIRVFSPWGREKLRRFRMMGWPVEILDNGVTKEVSGSEVRRRLRNGYGWDALVPPAVARVLREINAVERLQEAMRAE